MRTESLASSQSCCSLTLTLVVNEPLVDEISHKRWCVYLMRLKCSWRVDPVHLFLSLSLETVFRRKPPPIVISAVADMNINVCKLAMGGGLCVRH